MSVLAWLSQLGSFREDAVTQVESARRIAHLFTVDVSVPNVAILQNDLWDGHIDEVKAVDEANVFGGEWPGMTALAKGYLEFCKQVNPQDLLGSFASFAKFYTALQAAYSSSYGALLNDVVVATTRYMNQIFHGQSAELAWIASVLLRIFNSVRSEKLAGAEASMSNTKRRILLFSGATLCRLYFAVGQYVSSKNVFSNINTAQAQLSSFPIAQQVEFRYWLGRYQLNRSEHLEAFKNLFWAYTRCLRDSPNKRVILSYLLVPSILVGRLPSPQLLEASGVGAHLHPIITSLKAGTMEPYLSTVKNNEWLSACRLDSVLRVHMPLLIYRRAVKRLYMIMNCPITLSLASIEVCLRLCGAEALSEDCILAETVCVALINANYLKAQLLPQQATILFRRGGAWPSMLEVTQAMNLDMEGEYAWLNK